MRESRVNALLTRVSDAKGQRKVRIQGVEEFVNGFAQKVDAFCVVAQSHDWKQVTRIKLAQFDELHKEINRFMQYNTARAYKLIAPHAPMQE